LTTASRCLAVPAVLEAARDGERVAKVVAAASPRKIRDARLGRNLILRVCDIIHLNGMRAWEASQDGTSHYQYSRDMKPLGGSARK